MAFWQRFGWGKAKIARAQAFEGARMARRLSSWRVGSEGINAAIRQGGDVLRARSRDLVRNNPYANNATTSFAAHAIGAV